MRSRHSSNIVRGLRDASIPDAVTIVEALRSLTMRGGKRFRPLLLALGYEAVAGPGRARDVTWGASRSSSSERDH